MQWNDFVKSMKDLILKQNGPVEIIAFWKGMNEHASDLAIIVLEFVSVPVNSLSAE